MTEREFGTYQMLWDCPACGTEKLLGLDHRHCPNCGAAQDPKLRYFPAEADKVAVRDHRYTGADKVCPACDAPAAAIAHNCANCGSPLDEAAPVAVRRDQVAGTTSAFAPDSARSAREEHQAERRIAEVERSRGTVEPARGSRKGAFVFAGVAALLALVVLAFTWKKEVKVEVLGHEWVRTIAIERYENVRDSAWRDQVPFDARGMSCHKEQRSTRRVEDGQSCRVHRKDMGDGTFREVQECVAKYREEPVYDERCNYQVDRWVKARDVQAEGHALADAPRWPSANLARVGACLGCEREGARTERYEVRLRMGSSGEEKRCAFDESKWRAFPLGASLRGKRRVLVGGLDCDSLAPNP